MTVGPYFLYTYNVAYLRRQRALNGTEYLYIATSVRRGDRVLHKILEYLGRADKVTSRRLAAAKRYWGVKARSGKQRKRR